MMQEQMLEQENKEIKKGVIYLRLSKDDSENPSLSPEHQKQICEKNAEREGVEIVKIYQDISKTGANLIRDGMQSLLNDSVKGMFNFVLIKDFSRFSRDLVDQETVVKQLKELGIEILSADGVKDKPIRQMSGIMNEMYIDKCRTDQEQTHKLKLDKLVPLNRPPIGYKMKKGKQYILDNKKAEIVKEIFAMRIDGKQTSEISKKFKIPFSTILHILKNKTYLGMSCYKKKWFKALHPPIIDEITFGKAQ